MIKVLGIPTILGCNRLGCDLTPDLLRKNNLFEAFQQSSFSYLDLGNLCVENNIDESLSRARNFIKIKKVIEDTYNTLIKNIGDTDKILALGGDHSMAIGTGFVSAQRFDDVALVWIDAHADCNNPDQSPSGNIHGMPVATLSGYGIYNMLGNNYKKIKTENIILLGIKDVDPAEWDFIHQHHITYYTMDDIVEYGIGAIWDKIFHKIKNKFLHVSLDIDGLDYDIAPGTGIINNGGITYREIKFLSRKLSQLNLVALDIAEINKLNDITNKTINLAVELIVDFFGGSWTNYEKYLYDLHAKTNSHMV